MSMISAIISQHTFYSVTTSYLDLDVGNQQQLVSHQASQGCGPQDAGRELLDNGWCLKHNFEI